MQGNIFLAAKRWGWPVDAMARLDGIFSESWWARRREEMANERRLHDRCELVALRTALSIPPRASVEVASEYGPGRPARDDEVARRVEQIRSDFADDGWKLVAAVAREDVLDAAARRGDEIRGVRIQLMPARRDV